MDKHCKTGNSGFNQDTHSKQTIRNVTSSASGVYPDSIRVLQPVCGKYLFCPIVREPIWYFKQYRGMLFLICKQNAQYFKALREMHMENLNNRQREFLELLMKETDFVPIRYFAEKLNVSTKTLKGDMKLLGAYLGKFEGEIIGKTGKGICISGNVKANMDFRNQLRGEMRGALISSGERKAEITRGLLLASEQYTSIQRLADKFYVGKTSIVNDLKAVEEWLRPFGIKLEKNNRGTRVSGKEENIREAITSLLHREVSRPNTPAICTYSELVRLDEATLQNLLDIFHPEDIMFVTELLEEIQLSEKLEMSDVYYKNLLTHILICIQRVRSGKRVEKSETGYPGRTEPERYAGAEKIARRIWERYGIDIGEEETEYIYQYICSLTTHGRLAWNEKMKNERSGLVAEALTEYVSRILNIRFPREASLMAGLLMHIKPLLNRLEYRIKIANPFLEEMLENYPQMIGVCQIACRFISEDFHLPPISIDESANLAIYYQTMLVRQTSPVTVLVVCHSGFGTSQLLGARLTQEFPSIRIHDVISSRRMREIDMTGIDFVISTVPLDVAGVPYLLVSSFLLDSDIAAIRNGIYLAEQKKTAGYPQILSARTGEFIYRNRKPSGAGELYLEEDLQKRFGISIWKSEERKGTALSIDSFRDKVTGYIFETDRREMVNLLAEYYRMALDEELLNGMLAGGDKKEIVRLLENADGKTERSGALGEDDIYMDIQCETKEELMEFLSGLIVRKHPQIQTSRKHLQNLLWERETEAFTGIGNGTALVHRVTGEIDETIVFLVRLNASVDWAREKAYPDRVRLVRLILVFLVPQEKPSKDAARIKELVLKLGKKENVEQILSAADKSEIIRILSK